MKMRQFFNAAAFIVVVALVTAITSCGKHPTRPDGGGGGSTGSGGGSGGGDGGTPPPDRDNDGVPDSRDNCPTLAGEATYNGCPWYKVDVCSGASQYSTIGHKWSNLTPAYYYGSSLPSSWRLYADYAASTWNAAGSRLVIKKYPTIANGGVGVDGKNVVSYGPISGDALGHTYWWYSTSSGSLVEADIKLNSNKPLTVGGGPTSFDVYSVLTHEFGHFVGIGHVDDRTHTMYLSMPMDCTIPRTLCAGDVLGIKRLYP